MKNLALLTLIAASLLFACKQDNKATESPDIISENDNKYTLSAFESSQEYPDAVLGDMRYMEGSFYFDVSSDSYELGLQTPDADSKMCANSGQGQHIHLIVDNGPYAAKYTSSFEHDLADGEHYLLAFLSRSYHESIKTETANILQKVEVKDKSIVGSIDVDLPMLSYSRPKGTYLGDDTQKVMLDFYLSNVQLEDGYMVEADINGEVHDIDTWQPYYIEGMPMGENTITLTLKKDGNTVDTPLNPVSRTFTLKENPDPEN